MPVETLDLPEAERIQHAMRFLREGFPQDPSLGRTTIQRLGPEGAQATVAYHPSMLRPGGAIAGPHLMGFTDVIALLTLFGIRGVRADVFTTSVNIHFLRMAPAEDLVGVGRSIKVGRRSALLEVSLTTPSSPAPVTHATVEYAIVSKRSPGG